MTFHRRRWLCPECKREVGLVRDDTVSFEGLRRWLIATVPKHRRVATDPTPCSASGRRIRAGHYEVSA